MDISISETAVQAIALLMAIVVIAKAFRRR